MDSKLQNSLKRGVVLIWALITMAVTTTIIGGLAAYYTNVGSIARIYMKQTTARFSGQNDVEQYVANPMQQVVDAINSGKADAGSIQQAVENALTKAGFAKSGENFVKTVADGGVITVENVAQLGNLTKSNPVEIKISFTRSSSGGIPVSLEQTITFETDDPESETFSVSHPVFNHVYFANNYGHLESATIIANGDVGANGNFTVANATVNGFVKSAGTVTLSGKPKMWPRSSYMKRVADEYKVDGINYYTQVRPTDPIVGSSGGKAYSVPWPGGYDPVSYKHGTYGDPDHPNAVSDPGKKKSFDKTEPSRDDSKYKWPYKPTSYTEKKGKTTTTYWKFTDCYGTEQKGFTSEAAALTAWEASYSEAPTQANCGYPKEAYKNSKGKWTWGNGKNTYKTQALAEAARKASTEYKNAETKYNNAVTKYNSYKTVNDQYNSDVSEYNQAKIDYAAYEEQWEKDNEAYQAYLLWLETAQGGTLVSDLTASTTTESGALVVSQRIAKIEMPDLSDKQKYIQYCKNWSTNGMTGAKGGTLTCLNRYSSTSTTDVRFTVTNATLYTVKWKATGKALIGDSSKSRGTVLDTTYESAGSERTRTISEVRITGGYAADLKPFESSAGNAFTVAEGIEKGSAILIGTLKYPIEIKGPVFIDGDVIIRGFVKGQGTIYAGRNIHIIGDISYLDSPSWPHNTTDLTQAEYAPERVKASNAVRGLLGLYARGNIIVGDYASSEWTADSNMKYLRQYPAQSMPCDTANDSDIGYSGFNRDYTAKDGKKRVGWSMGQSPVKTIDNGVRADLGRFDDGLFYYYRDYYALTAVAEDCKYYESLLWSAVIEELKQGEATGNGAKQPTSFLKWLICKILTVFGLYHGETVTSTSSAPNAADVTEVDAVLFANHGIFGVVGGKSNHKFTLNGAMISRDEGLLPSFATRFSSDSAAKIWLNWDMRVKSDSAEGNPIVGVMPEDVTSQSQSDYKISVTDWRMSPK